MERVKSKLKVLRAEHNLTQDDVAKAVGVVRQTIAYIEKGEYMPSLGLAWRIANLFNKKIEDVFEYEDTKETKA